MNEYSIDEAPWLAGLPLHTQRSLLRLGFKSRKGIANAVRARQLYPGIKNERGWSCEYGTKCHIAVLEWLLGMYPQEDFDQEQEKALKRLLRQRRAVSMREDNCTLQQIADAMGLTRERVQQILARAERERRRRAMGNKP